jgi:hypothetical protein
MLDVSFGRIDITEERVSVPSKKGISFVVEIY